MACDCFFFVLSNSRLEQSEIQVDETIFILSQYIAGH